MTETWIQIKDHYIAFSEIAYVNTLKKRAHLKRGGYFELTERELTSLVNVIMNNSRIYDLTR